MDACTFLIKWQQGAGKAEALYKRSRLYAVQELYDREFSDLEAILPFIKSPALSPSRRAEVYAALSISAGRKRDHAASMKYSELAVREGTADPQVYLSLAGAYIEASRFQDAAVLLEGASGIEKKHPYYNTLAAAYGWAIIRRPTRRSRPGLRSTPRARCWPIPPSTWAWSASS